MAKKQEPKNTSENAGFSKPQGFTHGMVSDLDPHFQLKGSYSDAQNIRLTNSEGDTFTVENIEGNSLFVDLGDFPIQIPADQGSNNDYPTFFDRGPSDSNIANNFKLDNRCSIVGQVSYANQMLLIIVGRFEYNRGNASPYLETKDRTIFLLVDFNEDFTVTKVTDLRVCYNAWFEGTRYQYPDLGMSQDVPVRVEAIIENHCISRIYWTDNVNPLKTLNIKQSNLEMLTIESLDITPIMSPSQVVLDRTIHGTLPVGVYQYTFKYISENGGETTFAPLSNLYHVSDQSFGSSVTYGGGPRGNLGTQGFSLKVYDCDQDFEQIEMYALFYDSLNQAPRVALVDKVNINGSTASFLHTNWNSEITQGLEEILIESNTWDVCKDIAIKDNILFAANLKQKKNWISEKEWNVKVLRHRIQAGSSGTYLDGMLTTNDPEVKHYTGTPGSATEISNGTQDSDSLYCGHGNLLGIDQYLLADNPEMSYNGQYGHPMWRTQNYQRDKSGADFTGRVKAKYEYRYLSDKMTLGGESFNYKTNGLGGCRVTFGIKERVADQTTNPNISPFISATSQQNEFKTDFKDLPQDGLILGATSQTNTVFKASMSLGGSKDPHATGDKRGYQRGELYRFGVQIFDKTGAPGNVLWIGDIETPQQHDVLRQIRNVNTSSTSGYSPYKSTAELISGNYLASSKFAQDHRLSYIYGHVVPPIDVEWFSGRLGESTKNLDAYVARTGADQGVLPNNGTNSGFTPAGLRKGLTYHGLWSGTGGSWSYPMNAAVAGNYDDTHYLLDLYVNFEFKIPSEVCAKISGFRVVRAIRTEDDRSIVQQGLLNQTIQYGDATKELEDGYDDTKFSNADNTAFGDDPVFVNAYNKQHGTPTPPTHPEQPEYNAFLNGYLGLAENSYYAYYNDGVSNRKATTGGNTAGKAFYWPERQDRKAYNGGLQSYPIPNHRTGSEKYGPGYKANHKRMSAYFGGLDKHTNIEASTGDPIGTIGEYHTNRSRTEVSGSIYTLDSPDSAFGIRPYTFREGDVLRIDSALKLSDSARYNGSNYGPPYYGYHSAGGESTSYGGSHGWSPESTDKTAQEGLRFAARNELNDDYGVLIAKYYCWDPYYGIGMEITGGSYCGSVSGGNNGGARPKSQGWYLPIAAAKELSDGEIVPSGFFQKSRRVKKGRVHGFSNNTLGYVKTQATLDGRYNYKVWAGIHNHLCKVVGERDADNGGVIAGWTEAKQKKDFTYDTVSTMQMGLRSILIELNTKSSEVRKIGSAATDTWFSHEHTSGNNEKMDHSAWFAPYDLSAIYDQGSWNGFNNGGYEWHDKPQWMSVVSKYLSGGNLGTSGANCNDRWKGYHTHAYLCSIYRKTTPYGGYTKGAIDKTRYIPCGNFHSVSLSDGDGAGEFQGHLSQVFGGDTFVNLYSHQKTAAPYMKKSMVRFKVFPVESYVNTDMRSGLNLNNGDTVVGKDIDTAPFSNDWLYNSVYSQENTIKSALVVDEDESCDNLDLPYEIAYSNTKILGQKTDAFRVFPINQFHDMEGSYGEINRIINFKNEIYVLQDSAFSKLLVNPLSMLSDDSGTSLFTGTGETVENHIYISTKYGTRHRFSVASSEKALYFVDVNFGRLFRYDTEKLVSLGDALGQRNYLKYITQQWEKRSKWVCSRNSGSGASFGMTATAHNGAAIQHGVYKSDINSKTKDGRNYIADNPLKFIGITSIFDFNNKELMVTFHNAAYSTSGKRRFFADIRELHSMGSTTDGVPMGHSETLVYNEGINAFTSKYTVAPPQWLTGAQGAFIVCPENQLSAFELQNWSYRNTSHGSYDQAGPNDAIGYGAQVNYRRRRSNPLRLWVWDKHNKSKKTHFFGEKVGYEFRENQDNINSPGINVVSRTTRNNLADYSHEAYIEKVINSEASEAKIFDNAEIIIRPSNVPFSDIKYITDTTVNNMSLYSSIHDDTIITDEPEQVVINRRWDFNDTSEGWYFYDGTMLIDETVMVNPGSSTLTLNYQGDGRFRSPNGAYRFNQGGGDQDAKEDRGLIGKYNNIVRMRVKRTSVGTWQGDVFWSGTTLENTIIGTQNNPHVYIESSARKASIADPEGIDDDFVILEWDMSDSAEWDDARIEQIRFDLDSSTGTYEVDWVEIVGIEANKYIDGVLKTPLRTLKSKGRSRGTWSKIKYTANTTEKFNIFAILAKYRKQL